ncbi:hypothetical protein [Paracoccus sp. N5]|uniref:hypothetical protein n=1 Tax=Paracoccus sp. N5 TaxID=1101189 RepID=UPI0003675C8F|nr:hypothetical protein [Paracoccus sp. N5]
MAGIFNTGKQIQDPAPVRLTVAPVAQTAALRPVQKQAGSNARALADALGSLNGALTRYVETDRAIEEDPNSRSYREWFAKRQLMSQEELISEMENNGPNMSNIQRDAVEVLLADKAVTDGRAALTEHFNTGFDYQKGNAAEDAERIQAEISERLPSDVAKAAFYKNMAGFKQAWVDKANEVKIADIKQQVASAIVDGFRNTIDAAQAEGKSGVEVAGLLFEASAGNRTFRGLSGQEQNETLLGIAEEVAQRGDVDLLDAILNGERKAAGGEALPSLAKIPGNSSKAARLMDIARSRQTEKIERESYPTYLGLNQKVTEGSLTDADVQPLIANGTLTAKAAAAHVKQSDANRAQIQAAEAKKQQKLAYAQAHERQRAEVLASAAHQLETYAGVTNIQDVEVISKTGEGTQKITKKEIMDAAIGRKEQELQDKRAKLIQGGASEDDADLVVNRDRATYYAANGLDNTTWDMQFNNIAGMVGIDALAKGGAPAKQVTDIAELYLQVRAVSPAYAEGTVKNARAREFFEVYDVGRNVSRLPPEQAALSAASWVAKPETEKARDRINNEEREEIVAQSPGAAGSAALTMNVQTRSLCAAGSNSLPAWGTLPASSGNAPRAGSSPPHWT